MSLLNEQVVEHLSFEEYTHYAQLGLIPGVSKMHMDWNNRARSVLFNKAKDLQFELDEVKKDYDELKSKIKDCVTKLKEASE